MISVVIPIHNRKHFTRECLTGLRKQTYCDYNIIVVDDGSTDGSKDMIHEEFPEVTIMNGTGNLYWTAAVNMGIEHALRAGADYVLTLNNDGFPEEQFLRKMSEWAERMPRSIFCSYEIDALTRKPYYGGEIIDWTWGSSRFLLDELSEEQRHGVYPVSVAPGRGMLIPRIVFETIGLFDARSLPHYMADYDFACLARRHGFHLYCNYDAILFSHTDESGDKEIIRNKSIRNYINHLFSIKGAGNLRNYTVFTLRHSPPALVPLHLVKGYSQRILGYFFK